MPQAFAEARQGRQSKLSKQNKPRLVFAVDDKGVPISFIHLDSHRTEMMVAIIEALKNIPLSETKDMKGWVAVSRVYDILHKSYPLFAYSTFQNDLDLMAGAVFIDMKNEEDKHEKLLSKPIHITQAMNHPRMNMPKTPRYLKGTRYMRLSPSP